MNKSAKTAMHRKKMSAPARELFEDYLYMSNYGRVLDYGCGRGVDVEEIRKYDIWEEVVGYDPNFFPKKPKGKFHIVTMIYVVNVIEAGKEFTNAIVDAWNYVRKGGQLVIVARSDYEIRQEAKRRNWQQRGDGYVTGSGTFQRPFSPKELDNYACALLGNVRNIQYGTLKCNASFVIVQKV
jgi:DNA phosphorothioation-associated putative methyltransferase